MPLHPNLSPLPLDRSLKDTSLNLPQQSTNSSRPIRQASLCISPAQKKASMFLYVCPRLHLLHHPRHRPKPETHRLTPVTPSLPRPNPRSPPRPVTLAPHPSHSLSTSRATLNNPTAPSLPAPRRVPSHPPISPLLQSLPFSLPESPRCPMANITTSSMVHPSIFTLHHNSNSHRAAGEGMVVPPAKLADPSIPSIIVIPLYHTPTPQVPKCTTRPPLPPCLRAMTTSALIHPTTTAKTPTRPHRVRHTLHLPLHQKQSLFEIHPHRQMPNRPIQPHRSNPNSPRQAMDMHIHPKRRRTTTKRTTLMRIQRQGWIWARCSMGMGGKCLQGIGGIEDSGPSRTW